MIKRTLGIWVAVALLWNASAVITHCINRALYEGTATYTSTIFAHITWRALWGRVALVDRCTSWSLTDCSWRTKSDLTKIYTSVALTNLWGLTLMWSTTVAGDGLTLSSNALIAVWASHTTLRRIDNNRYTNPSFAGVSGDADHICAFVYTLATYTVIAIWTSHTALRRIDNNGDTIACNTFVAWTASNSCAFVYAFATTANVAWGAIKVVAALRRIVNRDTVASNTLITCTTSNCGTFVYTFATDACFIVIAITLIIWGNALIENTFEISRAATSTAWEGWWVGRMRGSRGWVWRVGRVWRRCRLGWRIRNWRATIRTIRWLWSSSLDNGGASCKGSDNQNCK